MILCDLRIIMEELLRPRSDLMQAIIRRLMNLTQLYFSVIFYS